MSFGEPVFPAGFNQKTAKEDLFVKGNRVILHDNQCGKTVEDSRRLSTKAKPEHLPGGASWPHMSVGRAPLWWRASWSLLEPSHVDPTVEFHDFL